MSWWLLENDERWTEHSAEEILQAVERGELNLKRLLRVGPAAEAKPLSAFIRELVWMARAELESDQGDQESPYFALVEHAPIPTAISDLSGKITYVNQAFCDFLAYPREELIGITVGALSHPDDHRVEAKQGNQVVSGAQRAFQMKKRYLTKGGELRHGLVSVAMLLDPTTRSPQSVLAQIADLTPMIELEEARAQASAQALLGRVARRATHDLKNLLTVLQGTFDLLQSYASLFEEDDRELVQEGLAICESGRQLVQTLFDSDNEGEVHAQSTNKHFELSEWLMKIRPILERAVSPHSFYLEIEGAQAFNGDPALLERALLNLCMNSKYALDQAKKRRQTGKREITVSLYRGGEEECARLNVEEAVVLSIEDSGVGIPPSIQQRVLEPYFTTKGAEGSGLGLATVWAACEQHNGSLKLESEEGRYSRFFLIFPLSSESRVRGD